MPRFIITAGVPVITTTPSLEKGNPTLHPGKAKAHFKKFYLTADNKGDAERVALMMLLKGEVVIDIQEVEEKPKPKRKPKA